MKRYYDTENEEVYTEDQLYAFWVQDSQFDYPNFKKWLEEASGKNGTLEKIADDWKVNTLRKSVANDISCKEMPYDKVIEAMNKMELFNKWTDYEVNNRPIDVDGIADMIAEYWESEGE